MNSAIFSTPSTSATPYHGRAKRLRAAGRSLLELRGISDIAGVISGSAFVLARVPVYAVVILFAGATCVAGVLLYLVRGAVRHMAGGAQEPEVAGAPAPQSPDIGGRHG